VLTRCCPAAARSRAQLLYVKDREAAHAVSHGVGYVAAMGSGNNWDYDSEPAALCLRSGCSASAASDPAISRYGDLRVISIGLD